MNLVLASSSPRRAMLLRSLGLQFTTVKPRATESGDAGLPPGELVKMNSKNKANSVAVESTDDVLILGADTVVYLEGRVLGKPRDLEQAREMLGALSAKRHFVYTGLTLIDLKSGEVSTDFEQTAVTFRPLSSSDIERYLETVVPLDRAGAYTVEGVGSLLVERFEGCYYNVLGLPLVKLDKMLRTFGFDLFSLSRRTENRPSYLRE